MTDEKEARLKSKLCGCVSTKFLGIVLLFGVFVLSLLLYLGVSVGQVSPQVHRIPVKELRSRHKDPMRWRTLKSSSFFEFKEFPWNWRNRSSQFSPVDGYIFQDIYDKGVFTFHDLCIEPAPPHWSSIEFDVTKHTSDGKITSRHVHIPAKHLVVYNAPMEVNIKIRVAVGPNIVNNFWWITFVKESVPPQNHVIRNHTAFFVIPTCEGNLHHFWQDHVISLYSTMKATKRLNSSVPNQLFYNKPIWDFDTSDGCHDPSRYEAILFALSIRQPHYTYHKAPGSTCYKDAVLGAYSKKIWVGEPENYVAKMLGAHSSLCPNRRVLIQQRRNRKILNADELKRAAEEIGFNWTDVVTFEDVTLRQQLKNVACSDILVGVQGAGLEWLRFMRPGSGVLEIAWPKKHWPFFYGGYAEHSRINYETIQAKGVFLNFTSYSKMVRGGDPISEEEMVTMESKGPRNARDNHWKWADVYVDPELFKIKLKGLASQTKFLTPRQAA